MIVALVICYLALSDDSRSSSVVCYQAPEEPGARCCSMVERHIVCEDGSTPDTNGQCHGPSCDSSQCNNNCKPIS